MRALATHFAPVSGRIPPPGRMGSIPLISVTALAGVPALVRHAFGDRILAEANRAVMLDIELIENEDCFIPQASMTTFTETIAKLTGEEDLGLLLAPHIEVSDYGCWGGYVLGAESLGNAIERAARTMGYHSRGDRVSLSVGLGAARLEYFSAARPLAGYRHVAYGTAGAMLSLCRAYLGHDWLPSRIEFDLPRPRRTTKFEDTFDCAVIFDAPTVALCLSAAEIRRRRPKSSVAPVITIEDLARGRLAPASGDRILETVAEHVRTQVFAANVSIGSTAHALETSVRSLQRELNREGVEFRTLVAAVRTQRAMELLRGTEMSVTGISTRLGYSAPAHFARAFRTATGLSPQGYRQATAAERRP